MERDKLLAALRELSDRGHGAAGFKPIYVIEQEILAEFDRLKLKVAELEGKLWDAFEDCLCKAELRAEFNRLTAENEMLSTKVATLQSQLDKISKPYHFPTLGFARDKADYPWIRHEGKADGCPICRLKPLSEKLP